MNTTIYTFVIIGMLTALIMNVIANIRAIQSNNESKYLNRKWSSLMEAILLWCGCLSLFIFGGFEYFFYELECYFYGELNNDIWRWVDYSFIGILAIIVVSIKFFTLTLWKFSGGVSAKEYFGELSSETIGTIIVGLLFIGFIELYDLHNKYWSVGVPTILVLLPSLALLYESDSLDDKPNSNTDVEAEYGTKETAQKKLGCQYLKLALVSLIWGIIITSTIVFVNKLLDDYTAGYRVPLANKALYWLFCAIPVLYIYGWIFNHLTTICNRIKDSTNSNK